MGMFGLNSKDKAEILEFPKTYGVILRGMHQDLSEMHTNVHQYKDLLNKYIRHSKGLQEKFELEVNKVYEEQDKTKVFLNEAQKEVAEGLGSVKEMVRSLEHLRSNIERKYDEIVTHSKDFDIKLLENKRVIDNTSHQFGVELDKTNREVETTLKNIKALESRLDESSKQITILKVIILVVVFISVVSTILHFV